MVIDVGEFTSKNTKQGLQHNDANWTDDQSDWAERLHTAEDAEQSQQRMKLALTVQNIGFDNIVDRSHGYQAPNREQPAARKRSSNTAK